MKISQETIIKIVIYLVVAGIVFLAFKYLLSKFGII